VTKCGVGFVGAGGVAARHARVLASLPSARVVAVTDTDALRAEQFAERHGAVAVPGLSELLDSGVDAVYVCVPPFAHGRPEEAIAAAGLAVFVEKPLGLDLEVPQRVAELLDDAGVVTAVGHHWRYSAAVRRAERLLDGCAVRMVCGAWLDKLPPVAWWARRECSGGQLVEQAVHVLDLARVLAGEVSEVYAQPDRASVGPDADIDGATAATLSFASGAVGTLAATWRLGWKHRAGLEVYADDLALSVTEDELVVRDGGLTTRERVDPDDARFAVDSAFVDAVLGERAAVLVPYAEALRTHRVACALARSADEHRPVEV
jgi:myo-inositol 2-dehydrogenase/D-chiro-inositol 1-dehydrogenase